jgi:peptidoglycan/xylan/chitin deacetylase (PgdA/CDA1 family)
MYYTILNIHGVGPVPRSIDAGERACWLDEHDFYALLDVVKDHSQVRLTVDDGNLSDYQIILPALIQRGLTATFFICSGRLDQPTFLGRSHVREIRSRGMGIGSHGVTHRSWRHLMPFQLGTELEESRRVLEQVCTAPVDSAACPFGDYDRQVLKALREANYRVVYTSDGGDANETHWLQSRTTVTRTMTLDHIQRLVCCGSGMWRQTWTLASQIVKRSR